MSKKNRLRALILAGGSGTRFWPLSRRRRPKQLIPLDGGRSLIQDTLDRLAPLVAPSEVWVCTTRALLRDVRSQLPEVPREQILAEPMGRNTAAAIGWSLHRMGAVDGGVAVLPADHRMTDPGAFRDGLEVAHQAVRTHDCVMTLGVRPTRAETGYGYLEVGETLGSNANVRRVSRFREKPDIATAKRYYESGDFLWNAGIFVFRDKRLLELLREFEPEIGGGLDAIAGRPEEIDGLYAELPAVSIDYAVMERCSDLATVALDCGWSDLGSWEALAEVLPVDDDGNATRGDVVSIEGDGNVLFADQGTIAVAGVSDLVVVRTRDAVLVVPKQQSQKVKQIVELLEKKSRRDLL
ncbi:MAG: sugar phosphate nucleotidyltransferase [Acidobacteriota bacterium]|nr:sugar phosphate nucleotidyltransferase [Acidobacteriota bacterium]